MPLAYSLPLGRALARSLNAARRPISGGHVRDDVGRVIEQLAHVRVLVVGDAILDRYLEGEALRFCREAPVPNVGIARTIDRAGGAANVAANARALGASVEFLSIAGDDAEGEALLDALRAQGVGIEGVRRERGRRTRAKHRVTAEGLLLLSYDVGDAHPAGDDAQRTLLRELSARAGAFDVLVVSDYGYGTIGASLIGALAAGRPRTGCFAVDSRRRLGAFRAARPDVVKPSFEEALALLGQPAIAHADRAAWAAARSADVLEHTGAALAAVTLDRDGAVLCAPGRAPRRVFAPPVALPLAAGAGDTFVVTLSMALACGATHDTAGELAVRAASIAVGKERTSTCTAAELRGCFAPQGKLVHGRDELARLVGRYRAQRRRVVLTVGCFDILHRGHVALLHQAKALGDVLVVGVNGDESIRRVKGPGRPINALADRVQVLCAIGCADHVVAFDEETACELVAAARPDVFVKGGGWSRETLPETAAVEACGGTVHLLPYLADLSTTTLIERISGSVPAALPG